MFNFQGPEIFIILVLALMVLGPERLPEAMRKLGNFIAEIRKMSGGFQEEFKAVVDEPMRQMRESVDMIRQQTDIRNWQTTDPAPASEPTDEAANDESAPGSSGVPPTPASRPTSFVPTFDTLPDHDTTFIDDTEPFAAVPSRGTELREAASPAATANNNGNGTGGHDSNGDSAEQVTGNQLLRDFEYSRSLPDSHADTATDAPAKAESDT